ncbi:MAG TPA: DUF1461 domain-containing protein [Alcanivoracaceae bacterium]|nr:DUF1461 domain-containing protein [Alcanivoracaceae bacterium]
MTPTAFFRGALWCCYALICLLLALSISLWYVAAYDYAFAYWYDYLKIGEHLNTYAAQNHVKPFFHLLGKAEHVAAFQQIANAVHNNGVGLADITYVYHGHTIKLLTHAEVVHLEDVARLFQRVKTTSFLLFLLWPVLAWAVFKKPLPSFSARFIAAFLGLAPLLLWLLIAGAEAVFYQFHIWLFPPEHPWFFYWEESLMSALMKAPYLFGAIALMMCAITIFFTPAIYWCGRFIATKIIARTK